MCVLFSGFNEPYLSIDDYSEQRVLVAVDPSLEFPKVQQKSLKDYDPFGLCWSVSTAERIAFCTISISSSL